MKRLITIVCAALFLLAACQPAAPATPAAPASEAAPAEPTSAPAATQESAPTEPPADAAAPETSAAYVPPEGALEPVALAEGAQAACSALAYQPGATPRIAYMPPATEFNYYMAIGEGIKALAADGSAETFMLAPQSGSDIAGQMKMLQDVMTQGVDAIIFSTHDEQAAAPLIKQAIDQGIAVIIVNSDIADFPTPVNAVVGYSQRKGTLALGEYIVDMVGGEANVGVLEGQPGYHSTERIGGFLDAFAAQPDMKIITSLPTAWNVETGNKAMMDMIQAHPEINLVVAANDYIAIGASKAAEALNRQDILIFGNDGDTTGLEDIAAGRWTATVNTTPFVMGKIALQVTLDCLNGSYPGGWTETPVVIVDQDNANSFLCKPENLYPQPSQTYTCE
ncbi:MAG: sugar ABC transporter substrate-binding protein [Anaerolineaceae bacterium]|nr:sugar ABC transporter substrate-binding protein [Anaerolineaceae bacterium]